MKLILGMAALGGQPYGGKAVSRTEANDVINAARDFGINAFDTSPSYGFAEDVLSRHLHNNVCTVYSKHSDGVAAVLASLEKLRGANVVLMAHNHNPAGNELPVWADGYSGYSTDYGSAEAGVIQYDCSIVSRTALNRGIVFIARSVFLRGALCGGSFPENVRESLVLLKRISDSLHLPPPAVALHWALQQDLISKVVVGPSSVAELKEIMAWYDTPCQPLGRLVNLIPSVNVDLRTWT
jgi:diketogulonate reductase-like aldo/keto reductase